MLAQSSVLQRRRRLQACQN